MALYCYFDEKSSSFLNGKKYAEPNPYALIMKIELIVFAIVAVGFSFMFIPMFSNAQTNKLANASNNDVKTPTTQSAVLGTETQISATPVPSPTVQPSPTPQPPTPTLTPTPIPIKSHAKNEYTIAVYGDSMEDTMGERLEYLEHSIKAAYPGVEFHLYNYGIGSQNVEEGLARWDSPLDYKDRHYPPIVTLKPDIIILGSYAYNPFSPYNRDRHWLGLTHLIQAAQKVTPNVYVLAEIAPLRNNFGKGPNGVNWDTQTAFEHSGEIIELLENAIGLSKTLNVPLIDAYDPSKGHPKYTNPSDGIHPSVQGHEFIANIITNTIRLN